MNIDNIVENEEYTQEEFRELLNITDDILLALVKHTAIKDDSSEKHFALKYKENTFGITTGVNPDLKIIIFNRSLFRQAYDRFPYENT